MKQRFMRNTMQYSLIIARNLLFDHLQGSKIKYTLLLQAMLIVFGVTAQDSYVFTSINTSLGLSDNRVRAITQLEDGRLAIATEGQINIYNGSDFSYLHANDNNAYNITNYVGFQRLLTDKKNRLWLKNQKKLICFDLHRELFLSNMDSLFKSEGVDKPIIDFFIDSNKNSWYLTTEGQLYVRLYDKKLAYVFLKEIMPLKSESEKLYGIETNGSNIFLLFKSGLISCYSKSGDLLYSRAFPNKNNHLLDRTLDVFTFRNDLYLLRNGIFDVSSFARFDTKRRQWSPLIESSWQNGFLIDSNGNSWLCSKKGLTVYHATDNKSSNISRFNLSDGKNIETEISTIYLDKDAGLWLGTESMGLLYYHKDRFKFKEFNLSQFKLLTRKDLTVNSFIDSNNELFIATNNGLFRSYNNKTIERAKGLPTDVFCNHLIKDSHNRVWVCTRKNGLYCIDNGSIKNFPLPFVCQFLYEAENGTLFLTTTNGFGIFNPTDGKYTPIGADLKLGHIFELTPLTKNKLIGVLYGDAGLFIYDMQKGSIEFPGKEKYPYLIHSNKKYHDIFVDHRKWIWFGTQDGLFVFNPKNKSTKRFIKEDGLINNNIRSITEDKSGQIWISCSYGISCIQIEKDQTFSISNFNQFDGVLENEFLPRSVYTTSQNKLYWGGLNGFNAIDLKQIQKRGNILPSPLFIRLYISGKEIHAGNLYDGKIILENTINNTKKVILKYNQNHIGLDVSALNFINPSQTYFQYKLIGFDNKWTEIRPTNGIGFIQYTNLPAGTYRLKIRSTDNSQEWSDNYSELSIVVNPPFWKTTFAICIYLILISCLIFFIVRHFIQLGKKKMRIRQEEALNQLKMAFFTNISHEFKTPLSLILTPLESILKKHNEEPLKSRLLGIYKNAQELLQLINELLDFRRLEVKGDTLKPEFCHINILLESIVDSFRVLAEEKNVDISLKTDKEDIYAIIDPEKIKKVLKNILSNALKFSNQNGKIVVELISSESSIIFKITDNGRGISEYDLPHIFERYYQGEKQVTNAGGSGIGLHLANQFIQMHDGEIQVESALDKGSTFTITIPNRLSSIQKANADTSQKPGNNKHSIVIVEDNPEFRSFLEKELSEYYQITTASNGLEGLEMVKNIQPQLVITDVMMPIMSGTDLCWQIKNDINISHIPVIILSAKSSVDDQIEGFKAHADAYVFKPFHMELLLLQIHNLIEQRQKRQELFRKEINLKPESIVTTKTDEIFIRDLMKNIENHLSDMSYSIEQLSIDMNMDRSNLYRKVNAITGLSPIEFMRSVRLKKAVQLLDQGHSISDVASMVGFGTVSYFSKCFKNEFKVKPSEYKKAALN